MSAHFPVITVDGPAASGKSTFGRKLAQRLNFVFVSSGIMYRALTWFLMQNRVDIHDEPAVSKMVEGLKFKSDIKDTLFRFLINGYDTLEHVRDGSVNDGVSIVAAVPLVRKLLLTQLQDLALLSPLVMEGRDIGTAVFPDSPFKFFIDADQSLRAERRKRQGEPDSIQKRDQIDSQRKIAPLLKAEDAYVLNSGNLTPEEMLEIALSYLAERGLDIRLHGTPTPVRH
jgi:cytidylate kinase